MRVKKAQAIWLKNTLLLPQRVKSNSDQGFALLSFGEKPCPLSLSHGFFTIQPSPSKGVKLFPKTFSNNGVEYAYTMQLFSLA
jgi:hypothetical protein